MMITFLYQKMFDKLPPENETLIAGANKHYLQLYENDNSKLYKLTYNYTYMSPTGAETKSNVSYILYKKAKDSTIEITSKNKEKILEIESYFVEAKEQKSLEEQLYGITVFDNRIIDTNKITINEIYNVGGFLDICIKDTNIDVRFLSESDTSYLPELKQIEKWRLISEKSGYQIYHGVSGSVQSDALKIIKENKEYYIDLSVPKDLYKIENIINDDSSTTIYIYLTQEIIEKIIDDIFNIII